MLDEIARLKSMWSEGIIWQRAQLNFFWVFLINSSCRKFCDKLQLIVLLFEHEKVMKYANLKNLKFVPQNSNDRVFLPQTEWLLNFLLIQQIRIILTIEINQWITHEKKQPYKVNLLGSTLIGLFDLSTRILNNYYEAYLMQGHWKFW